MHTTAADEQEDLRITHCKLASAKSHTRLMGGRRRLALLRQIENQSLHSLQ